MVTNRYFKNTENRNEQLLLENMIIEAISIYGEDMMYVNRTLTNENKVYGEDASSTYDKATEIEMYVKNVDGFGGDGSFMSKFGLEIRDQMTFTVAKRRFDEEIGTIYNFSRPREGDLVYFPLNKKCFQIKFVENKSLFYQLGYLYTYDLTCELFEYSDETFDTGIPEIDALQVNFNLDTFDYTYTDSNNVAFLTEDGQYLVNEKFRIENIDVDSDNDSIQSEANNNLMDWSEIDPFSGGDGTY